MTWSRRQVLRAAGATVALPTLVSGLPRRAWAETTTPPVRLFFFYVPNGIRMDLFRPTGTGTDWTLNTSMLPLADIQDDLLVLSGLHNQGGNDSRPGDHARGTGAFLTCQRPLFEGVEAGVSVDQVAAQALGDQTPFRSLELGMEGGGSLGLCDSGYACAYTQNIAWADAATPLPKLIEPRLLFDRLFAGSDPGATVAAQARRATYRTSVLDLVKDQADALTKRLDAADRLRLDAYLTGVRELERRLDRLGACTPGFALPADPDFETRADIMLDIAVSALSCDLTRYVTFMMGNAGSNQVYNFLPGVTGAHHQLSHHQGRSGNLDQLAIIDAWELETFGRLVRRMKDTPLAEGQGSLLEHSLVMFSSEISDGDRHNHDDLPVIVAGQGGGAVATGRHLDTGGAPIADLFLGMLDAVGLPQAAFGLDGTGPLAGLAG